MRQTTEWEPGYIALLVFVAIVFGFLFKQVSGDTPEVYYSVKTGQPVKIVEGGKERAVTPGSVLPKRYERVWVDK